MQLNLLQDKPIDPAEKVAGLAYIPNYIREAEETALLAKVDAMPWLHDLKRRVQHYGWKYDYTARTTNPDLRIGDLPDWLADYSQRLYQDGYFDTQPDQVIVNEYLPGQGISAHTDCIPCFGDSIASISLGSACVMVFSHPQHEKVSIWLAPRSLVILSGDARYQWKHAIAARKTDRCDGMVISRDRRVSLTFRSVIVD